MPASVLPSRTTRCFVFMHFILQLHEGNFNQVYVAFKFFPVYFKLQKEFMRKNGDMRARRKCRPAPRGRRSGMDGSFQGTYSNKYRVHNPFWAIIW